MAAACGHATKVRPTPKGQVEGSFEFGGPLGQVERINLPLPLSTVGASVGMGERWDLHGHLHPTALVFGVLGVDAGGDYLVLEEDGWRPALNLTGRLYAFTNFSDFRAYSQVDATASYLLGGRFLTYASVQALLQLAGGPPLLALAVGEEVQLGAWGLQAEIRWYEPGYNTVNVPTEWWSVGATGSLGIVIGVRRRFGGPW